MSELYAAAFEHRGKIKTWEAEEIVKALAERHPSEHLGLAKLLAFFMPKSPKGKTVEAWVASAAAKKDVRAYLRFVCATGTELVATDGARLHLAPAFLPRGLYDPVTYVKLWDLYEDCNPVPAGHPGKFPEYRRVIPGRDTVLLSSLGQEVMGKGRIRVTQGAKSADFFPELFEAAKLHCSRAGLAGPGDSMLLEGDAGQVAVVMPLREPRK
jgi:hypothetical protein